MVLQFFLSIIPSIVWLGSIHVEKPQQFAIILDLCTPMLALLIIRSGKLLSPKVGAWVDTLFEFQPAVSIEHRVERTNAFVALVFGYSVVAIMYQNAANYGLNAFFGKAALGLIQAFCFN